MSRFRGLVEDCAALRPAGCRRPTFGSPPGEWSVPPLGRPSPGAAYGGDLSLTWLPRTWQPALYRRHRHKAPWQTVPGELRPG
jgi:hypothetical protein